VEIPTAAGADTDSTESGLSDLTEQISSDDTQAPAALDPAASTAEATAPPPDASAAKKKRRRNKKKKAHEPFKDYADFCESISKLVPYRTLAINRAERAKCIRVKVKLDDAEYDNLVRAILRDGHPFAEFLAKCAHDAMQRLVLPSLEREIRRELTE
jgi:uncharacterized protein